MDVQSFFFFLSEGAPSRLQALLRGDALALCVCSRQLHSEIGRGACRFLKLLLAA